MTITDLALELPCPACGAEAGEWCRTYRPTRHEPGKPTTWLHGPRSAQVREAWQGGRQQGLSNAYGYAAKSLKAAARGDYWTNGVPDTATPEVIAWLRKQAER